MAGRKCEATKADGSECRAFAMAGSGCCLAHSPEARERHKAASTKGGAVVQFKGGLPPASVRTVGDAVRLLGTLVDEIRSGEIPQSVAGSLVFTVNSLIAALKAQRDPDPDSTPGTIEYRLPHETTAEKAMRRWRANGGADLPEWLRFQAWRHGSKRCKDKAKRACFAAWDAGRRPGQAVQSVIVIRDMDESPPSPPPDPERERLLSRLRRDDHR